jgi:peptidoglycan hydrolase-like protein with peptidoglycan-binding domain
MRPPTCDEEISMRFFRGGAPTHDARRLFRLIVGLGMIGLLLAACSSKGGTSKGGVAEAQAVVAAKQKAVTDAQSTFDSKSAAFCKSSQSYILALDRYGDVLTKTAPTVGDVKDGGKDLEQPQKDALDSADAAVSAQKDLVAAQNELAQAEVALAAAKASEAASSGGPTPTVAPASTVTAAPLASTSVVNRVKQAEADFTAAQNGISDSTALTQASQQFNAAAVALQISWLRLFADAGCLTDEQQKTADQAIHDYTIALQQSLTTAGYFKAPVDGVYGPTTVDAVEALQKAHSLPVTGTVDRATEAALQSDLQSAGGASAQQKTASTAAVQQTLKLAGFWPGPVDGNWTPALTDALKAFQEKLGVPPTGTVDAATIAALEKAIAGASPSASSSASEGKPSTPSAPSPSSATSTS